MIPLRDSLRPRRLPFVTLTLVAANVVAFVWEYATPEAVGAWAVVPARLVGAVRQGEPGELLTLASSMFLHGDVLHLLGNVWFLWIFGDNVEDRLGRARYLGFYLLCGVLAAGAEVLSGPASSVPMVGASGAIAGVLGAYLRLFPHARILAAVPIFVFLRFAQVRASVFLGLWFVVQIVSSLLGAGGVAWWAHIAGFVMGFAVAALYSGSAAGSKNTTSRSVAKSGRASGRKRR